MAVLRCGAMNGLNGVRSGLAHQPPNHLLGAPWRIESLVASDRKAAAFAGGNVSRPKATQLSREAAEFLCQKLSSLEIATSFWNVVHSNGRFSGESTLPDGEFIEPCLQAVEVVDEVAETENGLIERGIDRWRDDLADEGREFRSILEIAETEKIGRSFISRLLDLTLLVPDIQKAILEGRQREGLPVGGAPHQRHTVRLTAPVPGSFAPATGTPG